MHKLSRRRAFHLVLLVAALPLVTSIASAAADAPLAIKATIRSPISRGKPTRGTPEFEYEWDEHRYLFASAQHRDLFKATRPLRTAIRKLLRNGVGPGQNRRGEPGTLAGQRGKLYVFGNRPRKDLSCSRRTLPATSQSEPEPADPAQGLSERSAPAGLFGREAGLAQPIAQALEIGST